MSGRRGSGGRRRYEPDWPRDAPIDRRRLGRMALVLGALILLTSFGASLLFDGASGGDDTDSPTATPAAVASDVAGTPSAVPRAYPDEWYRADLASFDLVPVTVNAIVDGDTLDVEAGGESLRVRAYGFDTPERGERCYGEARERLEVLAGDRVLLLADERLEDRSGRQLRYLHAPDGLLIDAVMVAEGYAEAWRADGSLREMLGALEREARNANAGCLWAE